MGVIVHMMGKEVKYRTTDGFPAGEYTQMPGTDVSGHLSH
jgi:hypothetical protein